MVFRITGSISVLMFWPMAPASLINKYIEPSKNTVLKTIMLPVYAATILLGLLTMACWMPILFVGLAIARAIYLPFSVVRSRG